MHVAKMNSHALGWHPDVLVQRSVSYFDDLTKNEPEMCNLVLKCLSKEMKENFMNNIQMFRELREQELKIQSDFTNKKLKFMIRMEQMKTKPSDGFVNTLQSIFLELPKPLRFNEENFNESLSDSEIILTTLRLNSLDGSIIGFAKGGPLENYNLRAEINDENYGKRNTIFLEPIALSMGYWGLGAGHKLRQSFLMQAHTMNYEYLTSFAFRDVISGRVNSMEKAEFVTKFDPERWDYFRVHL
jgi:dimeric dUTPase (all-alpha-NTP-PPase superfamily)